MKIKYTIYSIITLLFICQAYSQKSVLATANKDYDRYAYVDAIATYERIAAKGYKDEKMFQKLGNAYYFNADLPKSEKWYSKLFEMNKDQGIEYYYRYAESLKSIGEYKKADSILEMYFKKADSNDRRAKLYSVNKNYLEEIEANSGRYAIEDAGINSEYSDYGSSFSGDNLIFASSRDTLGRLGIKSKWTNQSFTNLYQSTVKADGRLGMPVLFEGKVNSKFHESTPVFTKDGKTMYFTRNNYLDGKKGKDSERIVLLKIYRATYVDGSWRNIVELPFNSDNYSVAHPALSSDDKELYFASNMPGTLGQSDLFKVYINKDGSYSKPENLGSSINTEGRETFPFIADNNVLYFASDGRPGLGGLDIYETQMDNKGGFATIKNIGAPINSNQDDFALLIDDKSKRGFFTSNRDGGKGYDDIYRFSEIECKQVVFGQVIDSETKMPISSAKVSLYNQSNSFISGGIADNEGRYSFKVDCGKLFTVRASIKNYESNEGKVAIPNLTGETDMGQIPLDKTGCTVAVGDDLGKCFGITMIYFDLDKYNIRSEAALDLEKILDVLVEYPNMKLDIRSHTDSRQTFKYNELLSDRRAKSTIAWLVKKGIKADRLKGKGYGETQLVNKCSDGVECSEEEHQRNRRSEFIIVAM